MIHFILTRFNLNLFSKDKNGESIDRNRWIEERMVLFEKYCYPSVKRQSCKNFKWILLFDDSTPESIISRLNLLRSEMPQMEPVKINENVSSRYISVFKEIVSKNSIGQDLVITTYLDNDDAISEDFVESVQAVAVGSPIKSVISFKYGYQYFTKDHFATRISYFNNHFLSIVESPEDVQTIYGYGSHYHISTQKGINFISIDEPQWVEVIHDRNIDNDVKMTLKTTLVTNESFFIRQFGKDFIFCHNTRYIFLSKWITRALGQIIRRSKTIMKETGVETNVNTSFVSLIQCCLGTKSGMAHSLSELEFSNCINEAKRQTLLGVLAETAVNSIDSQECSDSLSRMKLQWVGFLMKTVNRNRLLDVRAAELTFQLDRLNLRSCVLKGQSVAQYYPNPLARQCGDIDIWIDGRRSDIVRCVSQIGKVSRVCYHHADFFWRDDVRVEIHFYPSWFFNPFTNKRFHNWLDKVKSNQFAGRNSLGFNSPDVEFDLVFSLIHIYRHIFAEGIGYRQLMDYYYILKHSDNSQRSKALSVLSSFRMKNFCAGVMYVLKRDFAMDDSLLMIEPSKRYGKPILKQIRIGGNFGKSDIRNVGRYDSTFKGTVWTIRHNLRLVGQYPLETFWSPLFKVWQWVMKREWNR